MNFHLTNSALSFLDGLQSEFRNQNIPNETEFSLSWFSVEFPLDKIIRTERSDEVLLLSTARTIAVLELPTEGKHLMSVFNNVTFPSL